jgi:hypothetical protein
MFELRKVRRGKAIPPGRFQIVKTIRLARRSEPASIGSRNFLRAISAHHFLDKIDIALQIAAIARDFPLHRFRRARLLQTKVRQDLVDLFGLIATPTTRSHFS